jgi:hypothetical protein
VLSVHVNRLNKGNTMWYDEKIAKLTADVEEFTRLRDARQQDLRELQARGPITSDEDRDNRFYATLMAQWSSDEVDNLTRRRDAFQASRDTLAALETQIAQSQATRDEAYQRYRDSTDDILWLVRMTGALVVAAAAIASLLGVPSALIEAASGLAILVCVGITVRRLTSLYHLGKTAIACDDDVSGVLDRRHQVVAELNQGRPVRIERSNDTD